MSRFEIIKKTQRAGSLPQRCLVLCLLIFCTLGDASAQQRAIDFQPTAEEREAGSVILEKQRHLRVVGNDQLEETDRVLIAVLDEQAASDYRQISIHYNAFYERVELLYARTITPSGERLDLSSDAVQDKSISQGPVYDELKALTFSLPAVKPGSYIEYGYRMESTKPVVEGYWFRSMGVLHYQQGIGHERLDPIRRYEVTVDAPARSALRYLVSNTDVEAVDQREGERRKLTWTFENLPMLPLEEGMEALSNYVPEVLLTTMPAWKTLDDWAFDIYDRASEPTDRIRQVAGEISQRGSSMQEKLKRTFYYVQKHVRYIEADVTRSGIVPHDAESVLKHKYGDCKDQAILLLSLLKAQGIKANPALVSPFPSGNPNREMPMMRFSHMIVNVPTERADLWLDTSSDAGGFPGIDWTLVDQAAFVIDGHGGRLADVQEDSARKSTLDMRIEFDSAPGEAVGQLSITMDGPLGHRFKVLGNNNPEVTKSLRSSIDSLYVKGRIEDFHVTGNYHSEEPYTINAVVHLPMVGAEDGQSEIPVMGDASQVSLFTDLLKLPDVQRRYPLKMGFTYDLRFTVNYKLPGKDYYAVQVSGDGVESNDYFSLRKHVDIAEGVITGETVFRLSKLLVPPQDYGLFRKSLRKAVAESKWVVIAKRDEASSKGNALKQQVESGDADVHSIIELAMHHLSLAEYDQALSLAKRAALLDPESGEAHYALGIALGFQGEYEASDREIGIARKLGYRP